MIGVTYAQRIDVCIFSVNVFSRWSHQIIDIWHSDIFLRRCANAIEKFHGRILNTRENRHQFNSKWYSNSGTYSFPRVNVCNIHQCVIVGQGNCLHFVHNFHTEFVRIDAELVHDEFLQIRYPKYCRTLQILGHFQLTIDFVVTILMSGFQLAAARIAVFIVTASI